MNESVEKKQKRKPDVSNYVNDVINMAETIEGMTNTGTLFEIDEHNKQAFSDLPDIYYLDKEKSYSLTRPFGIINLKPHQNTSLYYMRELEKQYYITMTSHSSKKIKTDDTIEEEEEEEDKKEFTTSIHYTNCGFLCDKVGAGKSFVVLALIKENKNIEPSRIITMQTYCMGSRKVIFSKPAKKLNTNILLVPHGLISQWEDCCIKTNIKYYTISKAQDVYSLGETCIYAKKKKIVNDTPQSIINDVDITTIENTDTKKKVTISRKKKSDKEVQKDIAQNETENIELNIGLDCDKQKMTELKDQITKMETEINTKEKKLNSLYDIIRAYYEKYKESIISTQSTYYSYLNIDVYFRNENIKYCYNYFKIIKDIDVEDLKNIEEVISKIKKLEPEIEKNNSIYNKYSRELKDINKSITGKIGDSHYPDINENYNSVKYQSFLKYLGHINKKFVEQQDLIIVSENFYNLFSLFINRDEYTVNRVIVDECNSLKGTRLIKINSVFTWLISSSVHSLIIKSGKTKREYFQNINSTGFIVDILKDIYEDKKENMKLFLLNDPEYIEQSILLPDTINIILACKDNNTIKVLNGLVSYDIMKMLNAGDINGIASKLDCQAGTETDIIKLITQKYEDDLKMKEYSLHVAINKPNYDPNQETEGTKNIRIAIKELQEKIANIKSRVQDKEECTICYDDNFTNPCITSCCSQKYCFPCITLALNSNGLCPNCNQSQTPKDIMIIGSISKEDKVQEPKEDINKLLTDSKKTINERIEIIKKEADQNSKYDNMSRILNIISTEEKKKILIVTEYERAINPKMMSILDEHHLKHGKLKGSTETIKKVIDNYKNGDINVLMVNTKYFGSGTNLENTTDIIIIHKMESDLEMQVIGRAQRFGRLGQLRIWKLYYQNEM